MRKLIASEFISLDGVTQDPGGAEGFERGGWNPPYGNDELDAYKHDELFSSDGLLLGRTTYDGFAAAWPDMNHQNDDYAERMNEFPKYVVSSTLTDLTWNNSHLLTGDLETEVRRLKQRPGQDLLVFGSGRLVRSLLELDLLDEVRLQVHPVLVGRGDRLLGHDMATKPLTLADARPLGPVVGLTYTTTPTTPATTPSG